MTAIRIVGIGLLATVLALTGTQREAAAANWCSDGVCEEWVATYDEAGWSDVASDVAVDSDGNVYVTGRIQTAGSSAANDYATIKYAPDGTELWVAYYDPAPESHDEAKAIAVDADGNAYVTGWSDICLECYSDYATIKYDTDGHEVWVARYNGSADGPDRGNDLAIDAEGNVYVTGYSWGGHSTSNDYATVKYDPDGGELWASRYDGPGNSDDQGIAIAVDAAGNVYVTGYSTGVATNTDYTTVKYDPDGTELWAERYDGPVSGSDAALALAVDGGGNTYVTGVSGGDGTGEDYATVKYDADGDELWAERYNSGGALQDGARALALHGADSVYVTGGSSCDMGGMGCVYGTVKYSAAGSELWVRTYDSPGEEYANDLAVDAYGNAYVTGVSASDCATVKYSATGDLLWTATYDDSGAQDSASAIALDDDGGVYVTGQSYYGGGSADWATIKYSQPAPVGGLAQLPDASGSAGRNYTALAALAAAALVALTAGAWYTRRRWLG